MSDGVRAAVIGGAAGIVAGCAVVWLASSRADDGGALAHGVGGGSSAAVSSDVAADIHAIRGSLQMFLESLGREHLVASGSAPQPLETEPLRDLAAAVKELTSTLKASGLAGEPRTAAGGRETFKATDLAAVAKSCPLSNDQQDPAHIVPELFGLSRADVYARFGTPSRVDGDRWIYVITRDPFDDVAITFQDGLVTTVERYAN